MSWLKFTAERAAIFLTKPIVVHWGESFPIYLVSEFPKSGGTWLSRMVADYLQIPFPQWPRLPLAFSCVLQNHWSYHPKFRRVFSVHRDGRDVITSLFYDRIRRARHSKESGAVRDDKIYSQVLGENYQADDIVKLLPRFMEFEFKNPGRGARFSWSDYVLSWHDKPYVSYLSYESLLQDCPGALGKAIEEITGQEIDQWRLETTVEKFSFQRMTSRKPGTQDIANHVRKGIAGDWLNAFTRESAEMFNDLAGDALVALGYEQDRNWIDKYEFVTA